MRNSIFFYKFKQKIIHWDKLSKYMKFSYKILHKYFLIFIYVYLKQIFKENIYKISNVITKIQKFNTILLKSSSY